MPENHVAALLCACDSGATACSSASPKDAAGLNAARLNAFKVFVVAVDLAKKISLWAIERFKVENVLDHLHGGEISLSVALSL